MAKPQQTRTKARRYRIDERYINRTASLRRTRRWVVAIFCLLVIGWLAYSSVRIDKGGKFVLTALAHSPGHLSAAHAQIEHDCIQCHASNGRDGFVTTVTDTACLKCHDAGIHNENQTTLVKAVTLAATTEPSAADAAATAAGLPLDNHPGGMRSSDCVHCHTEHQGEEAMRGTDVQVCLECHADLKNHDKVSPRVQAKVVSFDGSGGHPHFGMHPDATAALSVVDGKLRDGTRLKFNHAVHNGQDALKNNCVACHTPMNPSAAATPMPLAGEPLALASDRSLSSESQAKAGDMQPITFERNCIQCHKLELANGVSVSHREMAVVRGELAAIPALIVAQNKLTADDLSDTSVTPAAAWKAKIDNISGKCAKMDAPADAATAADSDLTNATTANTKTYFTEKAAALRYLDWLTQAKRDDKTTPLLATTPQSFGTDAYNTPEPTAAEIFVTYVGTPAGKSCNYCHIMNGGDTPAGFQYKLTLASAAPAATPTTMPLEATVPTTMPTTQPTLLDIQPTGVPSSPRRWFVNSHFSHAAHRDQSCLSCHLNALTSTETADILSPDIDSSNLHPTDDQRKEFNIRSCIDCHGPPESASVRSAPSNCVTCHVYHDRTKEDSSDAKVREEHRPTTAPASMTLAR